MPIQSEIKSENEVRFGLGSHDEVHMGVFCFEQGPGELSRYSDSLRAGRSGDRIPVGGEIFRVRPDRPGGPPSLLYSGYRVFPGGKADHPPPSKRPGHERVGLYLCSPSGPSWPVIGRTSVLNTALTLTLLTWGIW